LKSSHWSCLKACFKGYTFCFTTFSVRPSAEAQRIHERAPQDIQMILKVQSFVSKFKVSSASSPFRQQVQSFVRGIVGLPEDVWPSNFGNFLKMSQMWPQYQKIFFPWTFLTILKVAWSANCTVSLADGTYSYSAYMCSRFVHYVVMECANFLGVKF
jgi:hypothetical protein